MMQLPHKQFVSGVLIGSAMIAMLGCTFLLNSSGGMNAILNTYGMGHLQTTISKQNGNNNEDHNDDDDNTDIGETGSLSAVQTIPSVRWSGNVFIGYARSGHTLIAALLDAHPEIIIPDEYDIVTKWKNFRSKNPQNKTLEKYLVFYNLHHLSQEQSLFDNRANKCVYGICGYNYKVPGLWH